MKYTYEECLEKTLTHIKRYNTARNNQNEWDKWEFQEIRDDLSESLVFFGPFYSDLRADAEQAEINRKMFYEERKKYWRDKLGGSRGSASLAESNAMIDCKEIYELEIKANREYYKARSLVERIDQVLNSIASRLKILEKHDRE